jgi:glycosyltransferase involved in cell wall biosynthesis
MLGLLVIYDAHEDLPKQISNKPWIPRWLRPGTSALASLLLRLAGWILSAIVIAEPGIATVFPQRKTVLVQNFPDLDQPGLAEQASLQTDRDPRCVIYAGAIAKVRGAVEMVEAIGLCDGNLNVRMVLAGPMSPPSLIEDLRQLAGWDRVDYRGWLPHDEVLGLFKVAGIGASLLYPTEKYLAAQPTKLLEYLAVGLPVIVSGERFTAQIVDRCQCGLVADPRDPAEIARCIEYLCRHPEEAREMGLRGRAAVDDRYSWQNEQERLVRLYRHLLGMDPERVGEKSGGDGRR